MNRLRVLIVADDSLARSALAALLADQHDCQVAGQVRGGAMEVGTLETFRADVVLWDLGWDPAASMDPLVRQAGEGPPVLALLSGYCPGPPLGVPGAPTVGVVIGVGSLAPYFPALAEWECPCGTGKRRLTGFAGQE